MHQHVVHKNQSNDQDEKWNHMKLAGSLWALDDPPKDTSADKKPLKWHQKLCITLQPKKTEWIVNSERKLSATGNQLLGQTSEAHLTSNSKNVPYQHF
jgi:hypothetical protein